MSWDCLTNTGKEGSNIESCQNQFPKILKQRLQFQNGKWLLLCDWCDEVGQSLHQLCTQLKGLFCFVFNSFFFLKRHFVSYLMFLKPCIATQNQGLVSTVASFFPSEFKQIAI